MSHETVPPPRPKHEHAPTVIHDPEQEQTLLLRWIRHTLEKGPVVWIIAGVLIVVGCLTWIIFGSASATQSADAQAWTELMLASGPAEQLRTAERVGESAPGSNPAAAWALLNAAELQYQEAFSDLPGNRETALPLLSKARDLFRQAAEKAGSETTVRRLAEMGLARVLEARGELGEAIQQYKKVADTWPESDEARKAKAQIKQLGQPETVAFYQKFSSFKPSGTSLGGGPGSGLPGMTFPPGGTTDLTLPGLPPNHPPLDGPTIPASGTPPVPPISAPSGTPPPATESPAPVDAPAPAPSPPESPATKPVSELPDNPFTSPVTNTPGESPKP